MNRVGPETLYGLMTEVFGDPELSAELFGRVRHVGADAMSVIIARAQERGEVCPGTIPPRVASLPVDLVRHELIVTHAPVPTRVMEEIVDDVFLPLVRC